MNGLCPKYWTRWRYFKEITLYFWWQNVKQMSLILFSIVVGGIMILLLSPKIYLSGRRQGANRNKNQT